MIPGSSFLPGTNSKIGIRASSFLLQFDFVGSRLPVSFGFRPQLPSSSTVPASFSFQFNFDFESWWWSMDSVKQGNVDQNKPKELVIKGQSKRLKDVEIAFPIVYGTIAFWLGKKATEYHSHKWTVYVRGAGNEDLSVIVKRVVFQLHPSFNNPTRIIESPPYELHESGWGEFEIVISLFFHSDVCDKQLDLYHQLKLYPEEDSGPQTTKKPVVVETYDEIVFPEPSEAFFLRVQNHPAASIPRLPASLKLPPTGPPEHVNERKRSDAKDHPLGQWFMNFSEADELLKLAAARQQVQAHIVKLRRQLSMIEALQPQPSKAS